MQPGAPPPHKHGKSLKLFPCSFTQPAEKKKKKKVLVAFKQTGRRRSLTTPPPTQRLSNSRTNSSVSSDAKSRGTLTIHKTDGLASGQEPYRATPHLSQAELVVGGTTSYPTNTALTRLTAFLHPTPHLSNGSRCPPIIKR